MLAGYPASEVNASYLQFHNEEQVTIPLLVHTETLLKVDGSEDVPVRFQERLPSGLLLPVGCWFDAAGLQNVARIVIRNAVTEVLHGTSNSVVGPTEIFAGPPGDELHDLIRQQRTAGSVLSTTDVRPTR